MNSKGCLVYGPFSRPLWTTMKSRQASHWPNIHSPNSLKTLSLSSPLLMIFVTNTSLHFQGRDKTIKLPWNSVSVLYKLTATANFDEDIGPVRSYYLSSTSRTQEPRLNTIAFSIAQRTIGSRSRAYRARHGYNGTNGSTPLHMVSAQPPWSRLATAMCRSRPHGS